MIKNFQTINYEGDGGWIMSEFKTNTDSAIYCIGEQAVLRLHWNKCKTLYC